MKTSKSEQALQMLALPGLLMPSYFVPLALGFPPGVPVMLSFIAWILLVRAAGQASEERQDELYHRLSQQRQQTIDQVRAGEIEQPWSR